MPKPTLADFSNAGKAVTQSEKANRENLAAKTHHSRQRHLRKMTSPFGRLLIMIDQSGYALFFPLLLITGAVFMFAGESQLVKRLESELNGMSSLKGFDAESIVIFLLLLFPFVIILLVYLSLLIIHRATAAFYYRNEKTWVESLPFHTLGYWEFLSKRQDRLKIVIVYKNSLPELEFFGNIGAGFGFDHDREEEVIEEYLSSLRGETTETVENSETRKVTVDVLIEKRSPRDVQKRGGVIYGRKRLHQLIISCLLPINKDYPIGGIRIDH